MNQSKIGSLIEALTGGQGRKIKESEMNRTHPDTVSIATSSDVIADLHGEIERLERELAAPQPAPREPLTHEQVLSIAKACGIQFYPAQFSGVLETETDEHTLYEFAKAIMAACGITTHKERA